MSTRMTLALGFGLLASACSTTVSTSKTQINCVKTPSGQFEVVVTRGSEKNFLPVVDVTRPSEGTYVGVISVDQGRLGEELDGGSFEYKETTSGPECQVDGTDVRRLGLIRAPSRRGMK